MKPISVKEQHQKWAWLLQIALGERKGDAIRPEHARVFLLSWEGEARFNDWAQSLSPEDAAKLFAILHEP